MRFAGLLGFISLSLSCHTGTIGAAVGDGDHGLLFARMSPDFELILTLSDPRKAQLAVWKVGGNEPIATRQLKGLPRGIAFHPMRQTAIIADGSGFIEWDWTKKPAAAKLLFSAEANSEQSIQDANNTQYLDVSPDGKMLAVVDTLSNVKIQAIPSGQPKTLGKARFGGPSTQRVLFVPGSKLLCAVDIEKVQVFDVEQEKAIATLSGPKEPITSLHVSPDGKLLATGSVDGTIILWDMEKKKIAHMTQAVKGDDLYVTLRFSPDGTVLACGLGGEKISVISLFRAKDLELIARWNGPRSGATELLMTKDNRTIITFGEGLQPRYWDAKSGKEKAN